MEFKVTLWKSIISVIIGFVGGFIYHAITLKIGGEITFTPWILSGIIILMAIYLIWSLIQKKK